MNMVVSQRSSFECTYLVKEGNDYVLNSHNYKVEVSVIGPQQLEDHGFVIEFKTLKKLLDKCLPDHTFLYTNDDRNQELLKLDFESFYVPVLGLPLVCAESIAKYIGENLQESLYKLYPGIIIQELKLRETADSFVVWKPER